MKEVKRIPKVGEKIKIVSDVVSSDWGHVILPKGSIWVVEKVLNNNNIPPGAVILKDAPGGCYLDSYVVIDEN